MLNCIRRIAIVSVCLLSGVACQRNDPPIPGNGTAPVDSAHEFTIHDPPGLLNVSGTPVATSVVRLPNHLRAALGTDASALLRLDGVVPPRGYPVTVDVFLNHAGASQDTRTDHPAFLGSFTLLPHATSDTLEITLAIDRRFHEQLGQSVQITLVPRTAQGAPARDRFAFDRIVLMMRPGR